MFIIANKNTRVRQEEYLRTVIDAGAGSPKVIWKSNKAKALVFRTKDNAQTFIDQVWPNNLGTEIGIYIIDTKS